jgi:hypothetical protein
VWLEKNKSKEKKRKEKREKRKENSRQGHLTSYMRIYMVYILILHLSTTNSCTSGYWYSNQTPNNVVHSAPLHHATLCYAWKTKTRQDSRAMLSPPIKRAPTKKNQERKKMPKQSLKFKSRHPTAHSR